jgi:transcriptional regulator with XRE-family HTH domain
LQLVPISVAPEFGELIRGANSGSPVEACQEAAAARCGIHWMQLGKVERGQRSMRLETIVKIADGLDIDAGELVNGLPVPLDSAGGNPVNRQTTQSALIRRAWRLEFGVVAGRDRNSLKESAMLCPEEGRWLRCSGLFPRTRMCWLPRWKTIPMSCRRGTSRSPEAAY